MADVFEDRRDLDAKRDRLWPLIEATPDLDWLLLTKRPHNVLALVPYGNKWPCNVWLGATAENQRWFDRRVRELSKTRARILFLSCEPLLGAIDLAPAIEGARRGELRSIDWVIAGGESGHHARPMHPEWLASLRDQCLAADIRFLFKQYGNWKPIEPGEVNAYKTKTFFLADGNRVLLANVGKKKAGRVLDGQTWDQFPRTSAAS